MRLCFVTALLALAAQSLTLLTQIYQTLFRMETADDLFEGACLSVSSFRAHFSVHRYVASG
jgi:hypothetical protein